MGLWFFKCVCIQFFFVWRRNMVGEMRLRDTDMGLRYFPEVVASPPPPPTFFFFFLTLFSAEGVCYCACVANPKDEIAIYWNKTGWQFKTQPSFIGESKEEKFFLCVWQMTTQQVKIYRANWLLMIFSNKTRLASPISRSCGWSAFLLCAFNVLLTTFLFWYYVGFL